MNTYLQAALLRFVINGVGVVLMGALFLALWHPVTTFVNQCFG